MDVSYVAALRRRLGIVPTIPLEVVMRAVRFLVLLLVLAPPAAAQRNCTKGKPCGNTCIAVNRTCRVGAGSATQRTRTAGDTSRTAPVLASNLVGSTAGAVPGEAGGLSAVVGASSAVSHCTTGLDSHRDVWIVSGRRPLGTIGLDLTDGSAFHAPSRADTLAAILIALRCPSPDRVTPLIAVGSRRILLDYLSLPLRTATQSSEPSGNLVVREGAQRVPAYVWLDALGTATLRGEPLR